MLHHMKRASLWGKEHVCQVIWRWIRDMAWQLYPMCFRFKTILPHFHKKVGLTKGKILKKTFVHKILSFSLFHNFWALWRSQRGKRATLVHRSCHVPLMGQETFNLFTRFWVKLKKKNKLTSGEKVRGKTNIKYELIKTKVSQKAWCTKKKKREENSAAETHFKIMPSGQKKKQSTKNDISVSTKNQTSDFICHLSWLCKSFPMCATAATKTTADTINPLYCKCAAAPWKGCHSSFM